MTESKPKPGTIGWMDLTVPNADEVRDFYKQVVGWSTVDTDMGGYCDYTMMADADTAIGGVCHARGTNEGLPAQWLMYVNVVNLDASLDKCKTGGGKVLSGPRGFAGQGRYAVIQDPAGAVMAIYEPSI